MGEVIPHSFGNKMNWDNPHDPLVQRLRFLEGSPNEAIAFELEQYRDWWDLSREEVLRRMKSLDVMESNPREGILVHVEWLRSLRINPFTWEILGPNPHYRKPELSPEAKILPIAPQIARRGQETHQQAAAVLDGPADGTEAKVLPFQRPPAPTPPNGPPLVA